MPACFIGVGALAAAWWSRRRMLPRGESLPLCLAGRALELTRKAGSDAPGLLPDLVCGCGAAPSLYSPDLRLRRRRWHASLWCHCSSSGAWTLSRHLLDVSFFRSRRLEENADELMQERAERLKAKRNLDFNEGNLQEHVLDANMVNFPEGGGKKYYIKSMPTSGVGHNGHLRQKWVEV